MDERIFVCMECGKETTDRYELTWTIDKFGIPFKLVCDKCYDKVQNDIRHNINYIYLTHDEIFGEDE